MRDYTPKIAKKDLIDGAYYTGRCRNASYARWSAEDQRFYHWRTKFGSTYIEEICHPEDEQQYDVFVVESQIDADDLINHIPIPFDSENVSAKIVAQRERNQK